MGTQVRSMQRRTARTLSAVQAEPPPEKKTGALPPEGSAEWSALAGRRGKRLIRFDRLARNLAVVGALLVTLVALRGAEDGGARSVFAAVQESVNMEWDESLGKLTFVSNLLPESLQAVWSDQSAAEVFAPITGTLVHAWSAQEPYIELGGELTDVRAAADGELMSVAHGMDEELIVRVRHDNGSETLYGNLSECWLEEGAAVYAGDLLGRVIEGKPLCFELRQNGRSVRPVLKPLEDVLE